MRCMLANIIFIACCAEATTNTAGWFQWHGPDRTGTITEVSGWPQGWPPKELWRTNVGFSVSAPLLVNHRVYAMGWKEDRDYLHCLDAAGKDGGAREIWVQSYPCPPHSSKGTRFSTCYK